MSPDDSTVLFRAFPAPVRFSKQEKQALKAFVRTLSDRVANKRGFTCLITDDCELRYLNRNFLGKDSATDVLSFPVADQAQNHERQRAAAASELVKLIMGGTGNLGEVAISAERAGAQAAEFGHTRLDEICILMLHGVLHLLGMDHERDAGEMAQAERNWRLELRLPDSLLARASNFRPRVRRAAIQTQ